MYTQYTQLKYTLTNLQHGYRRRILKKAKRRTFHFKNIPHTDIVAKANRTKFMSVKEIDNDNATRGNVYTIHTTEIYTYKSTTRLSQKNSQEGETPNVPLQEHSAH